MLNKQPPSLSAESKMHFRKETEMSLDVCTDTS